MLDDEDFFGGLEPKQDYRGGKVLDKVDVTGMDIIVSSSATETKELMSYVLRVLLYENKITMMDGYVTERWLMVINGEIEHTRLGKGVGIKKPFDEYGRMKNGVIIAIPAHIRAAMYSNEWMGKQYRIGDKPKFFYVSGTPRGFPSTDVISLDWDEPWPDGFEMNWKKMSIVVIETPLNNILRGIGRKFSEVTSDHEKTDVMGY